MLILSPFSPSISMYKSLSIWFFLGYHLFLIHSSTDLSNILFSSWKFGQPWLWKEEESDGWSPILTVVVCPLGLAWPMDGIPELSSRRIKIGPARMNPSSIRTGIVPRSINRLIPILLNKQVILLMVIHTVKQIKSDHLLNGSQCYFYDKKTFNRSSFYYYRIVNGSNLFFQLSFFFLWTWVGHFFFF